MPHHCTVCRDTVKPHCFHRGHVTACRQPTCKLVYQSSREKDCPYCRNALQKRTAREGSIPENKGDGALIESGGDASDKENESPDGVRALKQPQKLQPQPQSQPQPKKQRKKKGKHVRETRKLKDIRRCRPGKLK